MKIDCLKDKLLNAVTKASRLTTSKNLNLPILCHLLLEAKGNRLTVKATNLDLGVELEIPVKVQKEGVAAVPGDTLNNLLASLPEQGNLKITLDKENLELATDKTKTIIKTKNTDEFPSIPKTKSEPFEIPTEDFIEGLKSVWYGSAVSQIKPELSSVFIYPEDNFLVFVATDSFRLAEKRQRQKIKRSKEFGQVLIPFKNALEIGKILEGGDDNLLVYLDKNQVSLSCGNIFLTSRVIDGSFPDYKQIIPKDFETEVTLLKQDLVDALKVATVFSDKFNQVNFKVSPAKKLFEIKTTNPEVGENVYKL
jgi:DNA polymerase III subunit beta